METRRSATNGQAPGPMGYGMNAMGVPPPPQQQMGQMGMVSAPTAYVPMGGAMMKPAGGATDRATQLFAVCESCMIVLRINGYDMSYRRIMERKCPRCGAMLTLPQEILEMLILYGHFIPESVAAAITLGTTVTHHTLRGDFVAAAMNELLAPLQTDCAYDVALPKRREGLGMSLRMQSTCSARSHGAIANANAVLVPTEGDLVVGGLIDLEDGTESPAVAARVIAVGDVLVAINKKSITSSSFEKSIRMLSHAASPVYLTFRRIQPVSVL
jgi:hypothetical protein